MRQLCLLKGVNVGGKNKLAMSDLRALFESLGHHDVETYIQSGNVVFRPVGRVTADALASQITKRFGLTVAVVLRTAAELGKVLGANPFADADPGTLHVGFMASKPSAASLGQLDFDLHWPDAFAVVGRELYLCLPDGMARTKLPGYLDRRLKVPTTIRNWRTVEKLTEMVQR
jgi:uncharacterized protein (DUF1697 family)